AALPGAHGRRRAHRAPGPPPVRGHASVPARRVGRGGACGGTRSVPAGTRRERGHDRTSARPAQAVAPRPPRARLLPAPLRRIPPHVPADAGRVRDVRSRVPRTGAPMKLARTTCVALFALVVLAPAALAAKAPAPKRGLHDTREQVEGARAMMG